MRKQPVGHVVIDGTDYDTSNPEHVKQLEDLGYEVSGRWISTPHRGEQCG